MFPNKKEEYVYDDNDKKYITARGIVEDHNLENNEANRKIATAIMNKIARKYRSSKEPVMSESDESRAEYQALIDAYKNNEIIKNKADLNKLIEHKKYEQENQKEYTSQKISELSNETIEKVIKTNFPNTDPNNIKKSVLKNALNAYIGIMKNQANKKFFPHTKGTHGLDYDIYKRELELNHNNLFDPTYEYKENNHIYKNKSDIDAKGSNFDPDSNYKNDPGIILFKQMMVTMGYQPSDPQELLLFAYNMFEEKAKTIREKEKELKDIKDSIVLRKNALDIPYEDMINDMDEEKDPNNVTVNPFVTEFENDVIIQEMKKDIQNHPYLTDETGEQYQAFKEWLDADNKHNPVLPNTIDNFKKHQIGKDVD